MPLSYSKFTYEDLESLGIEIVIEKLFHEVAPIQPSDLLQKTLERNLRQRHRSEKAKSEFIISPILLEMVERNQDRVAFFSGYNFDVDRKAGLKGFCDYIITLEPRSPIIKAPVFCIVEAKNENLEAGVPQLVAEMHAAWQFNELKDEKISRVYGALTYGTEWQFYYYANKMAHQDSDSYYLIQLPELLGVLQIILGQEL